MRRVMASRPALSVTQMHAMLRMAFRLGADLETAFMQVNNQLAATLADDRFITAFIGLLDVATHRMRFHSGGQAPILHFQAAKGACARYNPTSFPLAAMPIAAMRPAVSVELLPGDILALLSDGIYEYHDRHNQLFGEDRVEAMLRAHHERPMAELSSAPARQRGGVRARRAAGRRHHHRPGEARGRQRDGGPVVPTELRFARGNLRVHCGFLRRSRGRPRTPAHGGPGPRGALHEHGQVQPGRGRPHPHRNGHDSGRRRSDADRL